MKKEFTEAELLDPKNVMLKVIDTLCIFGEDTETVVEGDSVIFPQYDLTVLPYIEQLQERMVVLDFRVVLNKSKESFFECCAGTAGDTSTAIGMAMGSFMFGFLQTVMQMKVGEEYTSIESKYADTKHTWKLYKSNLIGMGAAGEIDADMDVYWNKLKEAIILRLGNRKYYYVKIFGSKYHNDITAEVRVNDVVSDELSDVVAQYVKQWPTEQFASHKQFFFFEQDEETIVEDPYAGFEGYQELKTKVKLAVDIYMELIDAEDFDYDYILPSIAQAIGDDTLAYECFYFLPEICAENAFRDKYVVPESVQFQYTGTGSKTIYKSQFSNYDRIGAALFDLFEQGEFGEKTNDIYRTFIGNSAVASSLSAAMEKGADTNGCKVFTSFGHYDGYIFR